jgi:hypothetical protein
VIIVRDSPFNSWEEERFGVKELDSKGFIVEFWSLENIFSALTTSITYDPPKHIEPRIFHSFDEIGAVCQQLSKRDVIVLMCGFSSTTLSSHLKMWQAVSKSPALLAVVVQGGMPRVKSLFRIENPNMLLRKIRSLPLWLLGESNRRVNLHWARSLLRRVLRIRALDFIWAGTTVTSVDPIFMNRDTQVTLIHNFDYDQVLEVAQVWNEPIDIALYIDHMGYNHPDAFLTGVTSISRDDSNFFSKLDDTFREIEDFYGVSIEIAAHPRAMKGTLDDLYFGRRIHYNQTIEKLKISRVILLTNASTVIGVAAYFKTPILGIASTEFLNELGSELSAIGDQLNFPVIWIDDRIKSWPKLEVDEVAYQDYVSRYLKVPNTLKRKFWTQVSYAIMNRVN